MPKRSNQTHGFWVDVDEEPAKRIILRAKEATVAEQRQVTPEEIAARILNRSA